MQKLVILTAVMAGLLTFPIQHRATTVVVQDGGQRGPTLVVDDDGQGNATDCDASDTAFMTIQEAVDFLRERDGLDYSLNDPTRTILVCPGTYTTSTGLSSLLHLG